jgi:hypothetical protein
MTLAVFNQLDFTNLRWQAGVRAATAWLRVTEPTGVARGTAELGNAWSEPGRIS